MIEANILDYKPRITKLTDIFPKQKPKYVAQACKEVEWIYKLKHQTWKFECKIKADFDKLEETFKVDLPEPEKKVVRVGDKVEVWDTYEVKRRYTEGWKNMMELENGTKLRYEEVEVEAKE